MGRSAWICSGAGAGPLTPDPSPRWGEGDRKNAALSMAIRGPLTPDPSPRWGEGDRKNAALSDGYCAAPSPLSPLPVGARGTEETRASVLKSPR